MNIEQARFNMLEQQIRPANVPEQDILDTLVAVKREHYFPENQKSLAFFDTELPLPGGAQTMTPKLEARILQEATPAKQETVLLIGGGNGYLAALLAFKAKHVTVMEAVPELEAMAKQNLKQNGVDNVDVVWGDALQAKQLSSYDLIIVSGSLEIVPVELQNHLNIGGRLFVVIGKAPIMTAQLITRESELFFNTRNLFETSVPRLSQAEPESTFSF
jgi:protein-L-isoaspartate(D-aspartate) O-methyltransferase